MSQTERTGTKNKKLGLKKRNTLDFSVFKSKYDKERTRKTPNTYTFLAVQKLREFSLEKKNLINTSYLKIFKKISWNLKYSLKIRIIHQFDKSTKLTKTFWKRLTLFKLKLPASNIISPFPNKKVSKIKINHSNRLKSYRE